MTSMNNKVVLITGGASGIGAACARVFAEEGAAVVATDIQRDKGAELVAEIEGKGGSALFLEQDVTDEGGWDQVVQHVIDRYGKLHCLVNNAGIGMPGEIISYSLEHWRKLFAVNVEGVFLGSKYCLPHLAASGAGSIVNISSLAGLQGAPRLAAYCATKGAVRLFTKAVAKECATNDMPVRCNSVHPGIIDTPIWDEILEDPDMQAAMEALSANERGPHAAAAMATPGGKAGTPEQVARVVLFLGSDASSYVNGAELAVDYGMSA